MSRADLLNVNASIVSSICVQIANTSPNAVLIVVTNPVDAMVQVAANATMFPRQKVMGMAGFLTRPIRTFIALELGVSVQRQTRWSRRSRRLHGTVASTRFRGGNSPERYLMEDRIAALVERTRRGGAESPGP